MADLTLSEIEDARRNPRPGDEWRRGKELRVVREITAKCLAMGRFCGEQCVMPVYPWISQFREWTRNATLVRRGDA